MQPASIQNLIYEIKGQKVMLDHDLSRLYDVETRILNQAVKRNLDRFPEDFMFQLTENECTILISQFVMSSWGGRRTLPYVFTEHGVTMLSSVLKSARAVQMNIAIVRAFIALKQYALNYNELFTQVKELKDTTDNHNVQLNQIYDVLERLLREETEKVNWKERERIGFNV